MLGCSRDSVTAAWRPLAPLSLKSSRIGANAERKDRVEVLFSQFLILFRISTVWGVSRENRAAGLCQPCAQPAG